MRSRVVVGSAVVILALSALASSSASPFTPNQGPGRQQAGVTASSAVDDFAGGTTTPVTSTQADPDSPAASAIQELRNADQAPLIETDSQGRVVSIMAAPGATIENPAGDVDAFVRRYAEAFGVSGSYSTERQKSTDLPGGDRAIRYQQVAAGLPVIGGEIVVTTDSQGQIRGAAAEVTSAAPSATTATVSAELAGRTAIDAAAGRFDLQADSLHVGDASLWIYDPALIGAPGRVGAAPVWWIEVAGPLGDKVATVLINATDGSVELVIKAKKEGIDRVVCDLNGIEDAREFDLNNPSVYHCDRTSALGAMAAARAEGEPESTVAEVNRAYDHLGAVHDFFRTNFGIDSFSGTGTSLRATVRACQKDIVLGGTVFDFYCPYPNAFWDGRQFVFGQGYTVDDITAHEYTHALIDNTSQLFYAYQSGAINESLADIFGELIDQSFTAAGEDTSKKWLIGEDLPLSPARPTREVRDMANPGRLGQPSTLFGPNYYGGPEDNGGVHQNSGVGNHLAYLIANGGTQQFTTFPGIGVPKSIALWYRVLHLLPSGADYLTLSRLVTRSCVELIGHHGFTRDNCFNTVRNATIATGLAVGDPHFGCGGGSTPDPAAFSDDFEVPGKWTFSSSRWQIIPSASVPVSYAASGKRALYGFLPSGAAIYATTAEPITIPSNTTFSGPYLSYKLLAVPLNRQQTTSGPLWQYDDVNDSAGWQNLTQPWPIRGGDYQQTSTSLLSLAGRTVNLRVRIAATDPVREWLIDDVTINSCTYTYETPVDISAVWSGTTAEITWQYASSVSDHFEFSYEPEIPGAPTFLPGTGQAVSPTTRSIILTGLDPSVTYTMTITLVRDSFGAQPPRPVTFTFAAEPSKVCLTTMPLQAYWSPTRARPVLDPCRVVDLPRKWNPE